LGCVVASAVAAYVKMYITYLLAFSELITVSDKDDDDDDHHHQHHDKDDAVG